MNLIKRSLLFIAIIIFSSMLYAAESREIFDESRKRTIPIEVYKPARETLLPVVIISHGYSVKNTEYSFIADKLMQQGYFVVSIQHDLETDKPLPKEGNIFQRRYPMWERGVKNILFVISYLRNHYHSLNLNKVILIGHSNGGDISMTFLDKHPSLVEKGISLDSLRYPFPIKNNIPILSLRASDTEADKGVLPLQGAEIIKLRDAKHIDMCDRGPVEVKKEIADLIIKFLAG